MTLIISQPAYLSTKLPFGEDQTNVILSEKYYFMSDKHHNSLVEPLLHKDNNRTEVTHKSDKTRIKELRNMAADYGTVDYYDSSCSKMLG